GVRYAKPAVAFVYDDDRGRRACDVGAGSDQAAEVAQRLTVTDDHEVPRLQVPGTGAQVAGLHNAVHDVVGKFLVLVFAHCQDGPHGLEDLVRHLVSPCWVDRSLPTSVAAAGDRTRRHLLRGRRAARVHSGRVPTVE